jgi:hypothetical protein
LRYALSMDVLPILTALRQELAAVEEAIVVLERLAFGRGKRRGLPPAWMTKAAPTDSPVGAKRRGRPVGSRNKPKQLVEQS